MRLHRFIGDFDLNQTNLTISDPDLINQVIKVLRLKIGEQIILADGKSTEAITEITALNKKNISVKIISKYSNKNEPAKKVTLFCAILKRENFELVVQKAVETGVSEIAPMITDRTVKTGLNMSRLQKIIKEAAEQSGRGEIPALKEAIKFSEAIKNGGIVFDPSGDPFNIQKSSNKLNIFIGPEGGFSENEIKLAKENNLYISSLGSLTLRAETAAIIASYLTIRA